MKKLTTQEVLEAAGITEAVAAAGVEVQQYGPRLVFKKGGETRFYVIQNLGSGDYVIKTPATTYERSPHRFETKVEAAAAAFALITA